jgi:hypothetical protein
VKYCARATTFPHGQPGDLHLLQKAKASASIAYFNTALLQDFDLRQQARDHRQVRRGPGLLPPQGVQKDKLIVALYIYV